MKILLVRQMNNTFKCAYDTDLDNMKRIKAGEMVMCEVTKPRNIQFHRKFFALLNLVFHNQEIYMDVEDLRHDLTIEAGFFEYRVNLFGEEVKKAKSISFAKMDEFEFSSFYSAVLDTIVRCFHFDKQDIIDNVEQYF